MAVFYEETRKSYSIRKYTDRYRDAILLVGRNRSSKPVAALSTPSQFLSSPANNGLIRSEMISTDPSKEA